MRVFSLLYVKRTLRIAFADANFHFQSLVQLSHETFSLRYFSLPSSFPSSSSLFFSSGSLLRSSFSPALCPFLRLPLPAHSCTYLRPFLLPHAHLCALAWDAWQIIG